MSTKTRVSIVIPVYNEADRIHDCLLAIAVQTVTPFEVLVVDNNSSDGTAVLAAQFPFVRVLREARQGVVYARDRGFNAARGDIIARIDADTVLYSGWVQQLQQIFTEDPSLGAVTGAVRYRQVSAAPQVSYFDLLWRRRLARLLEPTVALQGANMAITRKQWRVIRSQVCHVSGLHEDLDLSVHISRRGGKIRFDERLTASTCFRQADYRFTAFAAYALASPRTYAYHGVRQGLRMYEVVALVLCLYPIINALSRGYDPLLGRFSWARWAFVEPRPRVNPATFVD